MNPRTAQRELAKLDALDLARANRTKAIEAEVMRITKMDKLGEEVDGVAWNVAKWRVKNVTTKPQSAPAMTVAKLSELCPRWELDSPAMKLQRRIQHGTPGCEVDWAPVMFMRTLQGARMTELYARWYDFDRDPTLVLHNGTVMTPADREASINGNVDAVMAIWEAAHPEIDHDEMTLALAG